MLPLPALSFIPADRAPSSSAPVFLIHRPSSARVISRPPSCRPSLRRACSASPTSSSWTRTPSPRRSLPACRSRAARASASPTLRSRPKVGKGHGRCGETGDGAFSAWWPVERENGPRVAQRPLRCPARLPRRLGQGLVRSHLWVDCGRHQRHAGRHHQRRLPGHEACHWCVP